MFQQLPELVNRHLMPPDPVILYYAFNPGAPSLERPSAWDIEVKMEDTAVKNRMAVVVQSSKESTQDLSKLDDEVDSSGILRRFDLTYSHLFFRFRSLRSHCIMRTRSAYFCIVLQKTQQNSSRHGWSHSRAIWRVSSEVGRAKVPRFVQKSFGGVISFGFRGSKKLLRSKKACVWHQRHDPRHGVMTVSMIGRDVYFHFVLLCCTCILVLGCRLPSATKKKS